MFSLDKTLKHFEKEKALGEKAIVNEHTIVVDGYEHMTFLIKGFGVPVNVAQESIEYARIGGAKGATPAPVRTHFSNSVSIHETVEGHARQMFEEMAQERTVSKRPRFAATVYRGSPEDFTDSWRLRDCFFHSIDPVEVDFETNQILAYQGQMDYEYFGEKAIK